MNLKYLIIPAIFLAGCGNLSFNTKTPQGICYKQPSWVTNPPVNKNEIYGVGVAPENFNGFQAQRKSAITKAINEIATQLNTTVNSKILYDIDVKNFQSKQEFHTSSFQTVDNQKVKAIVIKSCKNPNNGYFYVLMKLIKD
jgi:hypothetical protein